MTKTITGTIHKTSWGTFLIPTEQKAIFSVGEIIDFDSREYLILAIIPPTRPEGKWTLELRPILEV